MAKLAPRRLSPISTLKQLKHVKLATPTCKVCGQRLYSATDPLHIKGPEHDVSLHG